MPTYYVEDYDGERNSDAVERETLSPVAEVEAKVVEPEQPKKPAKKTSRAKTKG